VDAGGEGVLVEREVELIALDDMIAAAG